MSHEFSYRHDGLSGSISVRFLDNLSLDGLFTRYVPGYDAQFYEAVAVRFFTGKETVLTVYALDKLKAEQSGGAGIGNLPVKKFKIAIPPVNDIVQHLESMNFTLSTGKYNLDDMEVVNR